MVKISLGDAENRLNKVISKSLEFRQTGKVLINKTAQEKW
jgi:hypothetical protein